MQDILLSLTRDDYSYIIKIIQGPFDQCSHLKAHLMSVESSDHRKALCEGIEEKIRYLGSSNIAYFSRRTLGIEPGVDFRYMIRDTARFLKVPLANQGTEREMLIKLVHLYAVDQFSQLSLVEQQQMLESLGVERKRAMDFLKKAGGFFALPVLIQALGRLVVEGLIKTLLFGWTARLIGVNLTNTIFSIMFARIPWWINTIIPGAWSISIGLTALQMQGPSRQKTVPILLYLGLRCITIDDQKKYDQNSIKEPN
ncbi:MAG: hypothetical protein OXF08_08720 [Bacteroidetes bacterium]|nr:hypothetical protein [Bacteroidota bacterium]